MKSTLCDVDSRLEWYSSNHEIDNPAQSQLADRIRYRMWDEVGRKAERKHIKKLDIEHIAEKYLRITNLLYSNGWKRVERFGRMK